MAITVHQKWRSPSGQEGENPSIDTLWIIRGTQDYFAARDALGTQTPDVLDGLVRQTFGATPLGWDSWNGTVRYGKHKKKEAGDSRYTFDTRGGKQHITQSLETIGNYAPGGKTAPDFHGAIGVTQDEVEGTDIIVPTFAFQETHYFAPLLVSEAYKHQVYLLTGRVNSATFRGKARGEVLFEGAAGSRTGDGLEDLWEITFHFQASPNVTDLPVGPNITVPSKEGWQYLWVRYQDVDDTSAHVLVRRPISAHVERLYYYGNFGVLGIGA